MCRTDLMLFDADIFDNAVAADDAGTSADSDNGNENPAFDADLTEQTQAIRALPGTSTTTTTTLPPLLSVPLYSQRLAAASEDNEESSPFYNFPSTPFPSASYTSFPFPSTSTSTYTPTSALPLSFTLSPPLSPTTKTATAAAETPPLSPTTKMDNNKGGSVFVLDYDACHCGDNNSNFNGDRVVECIDSAYRKTHEAACKLIEISTCAGVEAMESTAQTAEGFILSQPQQANGQQDDGHGQTHQALDDAVSEFEEFVEYHRALLEEHIIMPCCGATDTVAAGGDKPPTNTTTGPHVPSVEIEVQLKATA